VKLNPKTKQWIGWGAVAVVLTLVAVFFGVQYPMPPQPDGPVEALGTTHFTNLEAEDVTVTDDLAVTDDAAITGLATVGETLSVTGDTTVAADLTVSPVTAISVTAGAIITPTGIYQPLTSAAAVTTSTTTPIAAGTTGQLLLLENQNASDVITIDGTGGTVECKANVALGAGDTLLLIYDGADWQCLSSYDNS
jgi:hypothetical protein